MSDEAADPLEAIRLAASLSPGVWFKFFASIKLKDGTVVKPGNVEVNVYQARISEVIVWCILNNKPIRLIGLKPRQKGSSTFLVAVIYWMSKVLAINSCIIGGAVFQGDNLFGILKRYADNDKFMPRNPCRLVEQLARWANGSRCIQQTAGSPNAGVSATFQAILATEVAKWAHEGVGNSEQVLSDLVKTVANVPRTLIALESTAFGASGDFYTRWQDGITFEELQAGKDGFVKVFAAWFEFADSRRDPKLEEGQQQIVPPETVAELVAKHGLDEWQVAWMQWSVREECKKDFDTFCQDYPFEPETAFLMSGRRKFNQKMVARMKARAAIFPPQAGMITSVGNEERYVFTPASDEDAWALMWEPPSVGKRYILPVDVMTGATQTGGKDPDNHGPMVLRQGYWENGRGWVPPRVVARLVNDWGEWKRKRRYQLIWDIDVLARRVWALAQLYGNCLTAVEFNKDKGLIPLLQARGANLYHRMLINRREQTEALAPGFQTDMNTREQFVEVLTKAVREHGKDGEGIEISCPITLAEMETFIVNASGRSEAMPGSAHDDNVISLAIGLLLIGNATPYSLPVANIALPPDLEAMMRDDRAGRSGSAHRW